MTFDDAFKQLVDEFGDMEQGQPPNRTFLVCSGAIYEDVAIGDAVPALCQSREIAVELWLHSMQQLLRDQILQNGEIIGGWFMVEGPHLDKYHMTMMDDRRLQRIAGDRFCAVGKIGVGWSTAGDGATT